MSFGRNSCKTAFPSVFIHLVSTLHFKFYSVFHCTSISIRLYVPFCISFLVLFYISFHMPSILHCIQNPFYIPFYVLLSSLHSTLHSQGFMSHSVTSQLVNNKPLQRSVEPTGTDCSLEGVE